MTAGRYLVGILAAVILTPATVRGQADTAANPPSAPVAVPDVVVNTNMPVVVPVAVPQPAVAVEPVPPPIAVPHPAEVVIPPATTPPPASSETIPPSRAMPLKILTTQELLTRSIALAPGGSQQKLNAITSSPLALSPTNEVAPAIGAATVSSSSTNSPAGQPSPWQKNNPLLNGVDYHW
ncbi:MAG: hypothetical protein ABSA12_13535 [Verrucomicrobiia bacterium]|jgi:hypothetical protein